MTVAEWLFEAKRKIDGLDAELILLGVLRGAEMVSGAGSGVRMDSVAMAVSAEATDRSWLVAHGDFALPEASVAMAEEMLARRVAGEPLAYILGTREFYGREFVVSPAVLIPRPETEGLIELVEELGVRGGRILEMGTGSGCIAVTLAVLGYEVTATDVSAEALAVAEENARRFGVLARKGGMVRFCQGDLLEVDSLAGVRFDVLVANLPYVDAGWEWLDRAGLDYEPALALYAEEGGLALYKRLVRQMADFAWTEGVVVARYAIFEADPCQHEELRRLAEAAGLRFVKAEGFGMVFEADFGDVKA